MPSRPRWNANPATQLLCYIATQLHSYTAPQLHCYTMDETGPSPQTIDEVDIVSQYSKYSGKKQFVEFVEFHQIRVPHCLVPPDCGDKDIRLICFADAAAEACGAAVYAGMEISPGVYTSSLIAARSKLTKPTIPRNELTAIMLMSLHS